MSTYPDAPPAAYGNNEYGKGFDEKTGATHDSDEYDVQTGENHLQRKLKSRHMQMIAIGGAIGAGLFVGSGSALQTGGPASLVICFLIIGIMMYFVMQALAELGVMYPVNGAFFAYAVRFVSPAWGFATGWDYAIQWLTVLPFELTAAGLTLDYWPAAAKINNGVYVAIFLVALAIIQLFGIKGYGEVEFVLSIIKIIACTGFIILGIIIDCGGVPTDNRGYIGSRYYHNPGAFNHGFHGFCSVFVTAAFAYSGTELTGLAAAEAANPLKSIPQATKQVLWRILIFYVLSLALIGLIVPSNNPHLLNSSTANTKYSAFVLAIKLANIKILPSIFNVVITISVLSVANSCAFGSSRTMQALAAAGMGPKFLAYVDKHGRPVWCVVIQLLFGCLAFAQLAAGGETFFNWLLALSGIADFFIWGTICLSHIRFRAAWKYHGHSLDEIPYRASCGVIGSYIGLAMNILCLIASFYTAVWPVGGSPSAYGFFESYLAAPLILTLYLVWKVWSREWYMLTPLSRIDVLAGMRQGMDELQQMAAENKVEKTWANAPMRLVHQLI